VSGWLEMNGFSPDLPDEISVSLLIVIILVDVKVLQLNWDKFT